MNKVKFLIATTMITTIAMNGCKAKQKTNQEIQTPVSTEKSAAMDNRLMKTTWVLVELYGKKIENAKAFIVFDATDNKISGNLGCNSFWGTFEVKTGHRIRFLNISKTLIMCFNDDMNKIEEEFEKVLEMVDNYNITDTEFILNRARMAPLARFSASK
jgi:heat shock protein HslJ